MDDLKNMPAFNRIQAFLLTLLLVIYPAYVYGQTLSGDLLNSEGFTVFPNPDDAPDFTLYQTGGDEITLSSLKGKVVFLNFWTTWCNQCRMEVFSIEKLYRTIPQSSFEILAVNILEPEKQVSAFAKEFNLTFPMLLDTKGDITTLYDIRAIPTTILIDKDGKMAGSLVGSIEWDNENFISAVEMLIAE